MFFSDEVLFSEVHPLQEAFPDALVHCPNHSALSSGVLEKLVPALKRPLLIFQEFCKEADITLVV